MFIQTLLNSIIAGSTFALVALSFAIIYMVCRFFHFAHGAVFAWGGYLAYTAHVHLHTPLLLSAAFGIAMAGVLGVGLDIGVYRVLRRRGATGVVLLLASLGLYVVLQNIISMTFGADTKSLRVSLNQTVDFFGGRITIVQGWIILLSASFFLLAWAMLRFTKLGKVLRAVSSDPDLAVVIGIDSNKVIPIAFMLGSALAGLAAILISFDTDLTPTMGMNALMIGVVVVVIGGVKSIPGIALAAILLGIAQHFGVWWIGTQWQDTIAFLVLIIFLVFRPQGFFGYSLRRATV